MAGRAFTVRAPEDILDAIDRYAEVLDITRNEAINRAIDHYLRARPDAFTIPAVREFVRALESRAEKRKESDS